MTPEPAQTSSPASTNSVQISSTVSIPEAALRFQFARSGGPGGQHVNKVNTKAELWAPISAIVDIEPQAVGRLRRLAGRRLTAAGEIHLVADASRSQESNRAAALDRFVELIRAALIAPKPRRRTKPTKSSRQKRLESKKRRGQTKAGRQSREW